MVQATDKQIKFATDLGIENASQYDGKTISAMIKAKMGDKPTKTAPIQVTNTAQHTIILNKVEKPHSLELGKAGNRHKIYYGTIAELIAHIDELKAAGLVDVADLIEVEKL